MVAQLRVRPCLVGRQGAGCGAAYFGFAFDPRMLQRTAHDSSASAGVILNGDHHATAEGLLQNADMAMYQAKAQGKDTYRFFDTQM